LLHAAKMFRRCPSGVISKTLLGDALQGSSTKGRVADCGVNPTAERKRRAAAEESTDDDEWAHGRDAEKPDRRTRQCGCVFL